MRGDPVWLASMSKRSLITGHLVPVTTWEPAMLASAVERLRTILGPAGDPARERVFRMNATVCLHRALSAAEVAALPPSFWAEGAAGLAGGPVEILSETEPGGLSTRPCERPSRSPLPGSRHPDLWVPIDCGSCAPCVARLRV